MRLFFGGSAAFAATLLAASVVFNASPLLAEPSATQEPTATEQPTQEKQNAPATVEARQTEASQPAASGANATGTTAAPKTNPTDTEETVPATTREEAPALSVRRTEATPAMPAEPITEPEAYVATAYNLPGRTASGMRVARGIIAADPRVLPLGTRVRLEAGPYSGDYLVADTGGGVKGRKIDVWLPSYREARLFGRRNIRLRVLSYGPRRAAQSHISTRRNRTRR